MHLQLCRWEGGVNRILSIGDREGVRSADPSWARGEQQLIRYLILKVNCLIQRLNKEAYCMFAISRRTAPAVDLWAGRVISHGKEVVCGSEYVRLSLSLGWLNFIFDVLAFDFGPSEALPKWHCTVPEQSELSCVLWKPRSSAR